jgi:hypothetical protein
MGGSARRRERRRIRRQGRRATARRGGRWPMLISLIFAVLLLAFLLRRVVV